MESWYYLIPAAGVLALLFALAKSAWIGKQDQGNDTMKEIARQGIEEDIASVEEALNVLKRAVSEPLPRESDTGGA